MPKKMGVNSKAEDAKARKAAAEAEKKAQEAKQKEDQYWREAEGSKSRSAKKREEEEQKRAEAAAKKAEARRLAEQEEQEIEKSLKKLDKKANRVMGATPTKVTEAELRRRKEKEEEEMRRKAEEAKKKQSRMAGEDEYEKIVLVENRNREGDLIEAHTVEEALAQISVADTLPVDKHPEKRLKASFKAFEEAELPRLKADKPGLTHTQYKEMIWKLWKKSPDNPLNRVEE
ncbi:coiled-coil domain-containing protein 124-like [Chenopodium quinoa]|uniref:coiled-coil domain-containing protein 124-like n=1 Tax=Chenopodium quinoa TaxID=63459 RepID=UPI000B79831C|nr:coiled-coil domain-containing protein 124-like [Chenopodium quinoa]